ncbi:LysE family translocator [Acetobacter persici]|uniref:LysE family translocator n=1 Tax=Acetobacter persici TaxID=1076596 RepID=UPI0039E7D1BD
MIDVPLLLAFVAAATVLTITPGIHTPMILRQAASERRRSAAYSAVGIAAGCLFWGVGASFGLGALLRASTVGYTIVRFAGALYLVWLGVRLLLRPRATFDATGAAMTRRGGMMALQRGFLSNLLNPKVGVFYVTFLPQFVPAGATVAGYSFLLACIHVLLTLAWFALLIAATLPLRRFLQRPAAIRLLDRLTGTVFIGFGARLALSSSR